MNDEVNALLNTLYYEGYLDTITNLYIRIKNTHLDKFEPFTFNMVKDILSKHPSRPDRILWSVLVDLYGDYGTAPRSGWIEDKDGVENVLREYLKGMCVI